MTQRIPINDLQRSWIAKAEGAAQAVLRVLHSGNYVQGEELGALERELAEYLKAQGVRGVASGLDALTLALEVFGCSRGDRVLCAPNAGGYASLAASRLGCSVGLVDVDESSHVVTPETVSTAVTPDTAAVVVTHLYGNVVDVVGVREICDPLGVFVIEDCAQAAGAQLGARKVGSLGHAGAFSFYPTKNLAGFGDGGAISSDDGSVLETVGRLRNYGWASRYRIADSGGINSRLDEVQAAVIRLGLARLDECNTRRLLIAKRYAAALEGTAVSSVNSLKSGSVVHLCVLQTRSPGQRDELAEFLAWKGIETSVHYPILDSDQPGLSDTVSWGQTPVARHASATVLTVPCFPELRDEEVDYIADCLEEFGVKAKW